MSEEGLSQHHTHFLVVRDIRHLLIVLCFLHAEVLQQLGGFALCLVTVHLGKSHLKFCGSVAVLLSHFGLAIEGFALFHVIPHGLVTHQHGVHHGEFVVFEVVLFEHTQALAWLHLYGSLVGLQLTADRAEEGGFASPVSADDAIDIATCKLQVYVLVEDLLAKLYLQVCNCNHLFSIPYLM